MSGNKAGINVAMAGGNLSIYNNTITDAMDSFSGAVAFALPGANVLFKNNIVTNSSTGITTDDAITLNNNLVYGNTTNYSGVTAGANDISLDPLFLSSTDFRLQKSSPAIGAGTDLTASGVTTDILGVPRPQGSGYDIGAYEYYDIPVTLATTPSTPSTTTTPTVTGSATTISGATISSVSYSVDNGSWTSSGVTGTSSWSLTIPTSSALSSGSHTIRVRATDSYGNVTDSTLYGSTTFIVDTLAPSLVSVLSPVGYSRDNVKPTLSFTYATDQTTSISSYLVSLNREGKEKLTVDALPGSFTGLYKDNDQVRVSYDSPNKLSIYFKALDQEPLSEGKYTWDVVAYDNAGNSSKTVTTFYLDQTNPELGEITVTNPTSSFPSFLTTTNETEGEVTLTITKLVNNQYLPLGVDSYSLSDLSSTLPNLTLTPKQPLTRGNYQVTITVTDKVGNPTSKTIYLTYGVGVRTTPTTQPIVKPLLTSSSVKPTTPIVTPLLTPTPKPTQPATTQAPSTPSTSTPLTFWGWLSQLINKLLGQ